MNSTDQAWRKFLKSEMVEDVPSKDVSLEGKLDTISAQLNKIEVDSARVAATVPELLGDQGVEEALKEEEDLPDLPGQDDTETEEVPAEDDAVTDESSEKSGDSGEGTGEPIALDGDEPVGGEEDPEGIFTEDGDKSDEGQKEASVPETESIEEDSPESEDVPDETPSDGTDDESAQDEAGVPDAEAEPDKEGESKEDETERIVADQPITSEEAEVAVEEGVPIKDVAGSEDPKKPVAKSSFLRAMTGTRKSGNMKSIKKEDVAPETEAGLQDDADALLTPETEKVEEAEGAATAGTAGAVNAVYGDLEEESKDPKEEVVEQVKSCCKSQFLAKYGVGPTQQTNDGEPGKTGTGQKQKGSRRDKAGWTDHDYAIEAREKRTDRRNDGAHGRQSNKDVSGKKNTGYDTYGSKGDGKKKKQRNETEAASHKRRVEREKAARQAAKKSVDVSPTVQSAKHIATMAEVRTHQRPVAKATANGEFERPSLSSTSMRKASPEMGRGVDPKLVVANDWADYEAFKKSRKLRY